MLCRDRRKDPSASDSARVARINGVVVGDSIEVCLWASR